MSRIGLLATLLLSVVAAAGAGAQTLDEADRLLAAGDTTGALGALERLVRRRDRDPELRYRAGVLYLSRVEPGAAASANRRRAEEHLRLATRLQGDSAKYWYALALALRTETDVTARLQVTGLLDRALRLARRHPTPLHADIAYRAARAAWDRYEHAAHRHVLVDGSADIDHDAFLNDWAYVEDLFRRRLRPDFAGLVEWRTAVRYLREAVTADPAHVPAVGLYLVALGERDEWDSAWAAAGRLVAAAPRDGRARELLGLAAVRTGRWAAGEAAFDSALALLPPDEAVPYRRLAPILSPDTDPAPLERAAETAYWPAADPLWLTPVNEARLEYRARLTYARHRWTDDLRGFGGLDTDRGAVYVRYGPPDRAATLGPGGADVGRVRIDTSPDRDDPDGWRRDAAERLDRERNRLLWVYQRSRRRYLFGLNPGYSRATFAGDAGGAFARDGRAEPVRYDNLPLVARLDSLDVLVHQFRGAAPGTTALAIFGAAPDWLPSAVGDTAARLAAWLLADDGPRPLAEPVAVGDGDRLRRWAAEAGPGERVVRVEAWTRDPERAARGTAVVPVRAVAPGAVALSDVVVASRLAGPDDPRRWYAVDFTPVLAPVPPGAPVSLLWEVYEPTAVDGRAAYGVEVRVTAESLERGGLAARIVGGVADALGLSAVGDDAVVLRYDRDVPAALAAVEYLTLDLGDLPAGRYRVTVTVTDRTTRRTATAERRFAVRG